MSSWASDHFQALKWTGVTKVTTQLESPYAITVRKIDFAHAHLI